MAAPTSSQNSQHGTTSKQAKTIKEDQDYSTRDFNMSTGDTHKNPATGTLMLELLGKDKEGNFTVRHPQTGNTCTIEDTFAEMFPMWAGRILITAENEKWALTAATGATGLATSVIMSPAEAGIEGVTPAEKTPDHRPGAIIQIYNRDRFELKAQMILRIGQCIMTCPTTSAFDAMPQAKRRLKVGKSLRLFGDGFQRKGTVAERKVWKIPVMEGDFTVENTFGAAQAVAGGNFLILAADQNSGLQAAEKAVKAINTNADQVIMPFPGGICRSGSKAGSLKYKLKASTNHPYCPKLRTLVEDTKIPENVNSVYEIVINGLTLEAIKKAMAEGVNAAASVPGVAKISAGNYEGKLGPYKAYLREFIKTP
jgi:formylmethanofuran--tetrahydromethanopterin N-formyltransferase